MSKSLRRITGRTESGSLLEGGVGPWVEGKGSVEGGECARRVVAAKCNQPLYMAKVLASPIREVKVAGSSVR